MGHKSRQELLELMGLWYPFSSPQCVWIAPDPSQEDSGLVVALIQAALGRTPASELWSAAPSLSLPSPPLPVVLTVAVGCWCLQLDCEVSLHSGRWSEGEQTTVWAQSLQRTSCPFFCKFCVGKGSLRTLAPEASRWAALRAPLVSASWAPAPLWKGGKARGSDQLC